MRFMQTVIFILYEALPLVCHALYHHYSVYGNELLPDPNVSDFLTLCPSTQCVTVF